MESHLKILCQGDEVALSPNGEKIYIGKGFDGGFIANIDGTNLKQVNRTGFRAQWSPNGEDLAITNNITWKPFGVFMVDSEGNNKRHVVDLEIENAHVKWSPNGKKLLVSDDYVGLHVFNKDGTDITQLTKSTTFSGASWSSDSSKIVYCDCQHRSPNLMMYDLNLSRTVMLLPHVFTSPIWIPFTDYVFVEYEQNKKYWLGFVDVSTKKFVPLTRNDWKFSSGSWSCSPDGKNIVAWFKREKGFLKSDTDEGIVLFNWQSRKKQKIIDVSSLQYSGYKGSGFSWSTDSAQFLFGSGSIYLVSLRL